MFGYIKVYAPKLRLCEWECYRAYYCGLCKSMGSCTGQCSRMALSYDFAFFAAVRCALAKEKPETKKFRCSVHPFHKRLMVKKSPQLAFCADASALLSAAKLEDDLHDEHGFLRLRAAFGKLFFHRAERLAKKRHPELYQKLVARLAELHQIEADETLVSADAPAEVFGALMADLLSDGLTGKEARIAVALGDSIGRWVYLADAADDLKEDAKKKRYNPLLRLFGEHPTEADWESLRNGLSATLLPACRAFELMDDFPTPELQEIIANILYIGLPKMNEKLTTMPQNSKKGEPR